MLYVSFLFNPLNSLVNRYSVISTLQIRKLKKKTLKVNLSQYRPGECTAISATLQKSVCVLDRVELLSSPMLTEWTLHLSDLSSFISRDLRSVSLRKPNPAAFP